MGFPDATSENRRDGLLSHLRGLRDAVDAAMVLGASVVRRAGPAAEVEAWQALRRLVGPAGETRTGEAVPAVTLARLAHGARVTILAATRAPDLAPLLRARCAAIERHAAILELVTARVGEVLGPLGAETTCLLKGSAAIGLAYDRPAERERRDLDLLVLPSAFQGVRTALWNDGWRDDPTRDAPGPPFSGRSFGMVRRFGAVTVSLDLHRDLVDRAWCGLRGPAFREAFLAGAIRGRAPLPVSSPVDTGLHTLAHLAAGGFRPTLGAWIDLTRLVPGVGPEALAEAAARWRLRGAAWVGVATLGRWFGQALPEHARALDLPRARQALLSRIYGGDGGDLLTAPTTALRAVHAARALLGDRD